MTDPITEADLHAFADGQLPEARRVEVEDYLARHPEIAARVMADLRSRDALRLAFGGPPARPSAELVGAARRLERGLFWHRAGLRLQRAAAVALLVGIGWVAHSQSGLSGIANSEAAPMPPAYVEDARHAHLTAQVRARIASQLRGGVYDPAEIEAATGIDLPPLPPDWRVVDAQVFPSRLGLSVEIALEAGPLGRVSVFAARSPSFDVIAPTPVRSPQDTTVYWQSGERVYALTGAVPVVALEQAAARLGAGG